MLSLFLLVSMEISYLIYGAGRSYLSALLSTVWTECRTAKRGGNHNNEFLCSQDVDTSSGKATRDSSILTIPPAFSRIQTNGTFFGHRIIHCLVPFCASNSITTNILGSRSGILNQPRPDLNGYSRLTRFRA
ncbi:hypothetical protein IW261DRAFT_891547 [Armillaria novae-zelandiae]|uniref:Secreted protein n=1 Tax=Armillaria novae-zelandiae TaxID=153914 RepID=A0AA39UJE0_9AGAR|nr:hypothetical protein IW261DRAFT_891547 [Armillaria novae-zelandiae]